MADVVQLAGVRNRTLASLPISYSTLMAKLAGEEEAVEVEEEVVEVVVGVALPVAAQSDWESRAGYLVVANDDTPKGIFPSKPHYYTQKVHRYISTNTISSSLQGLEEYL